MPAEESRSESNGKTIGNESSFFGGDEVSEFVNKYTDTEGEYAGKDEPKVKKKLH
tara:strand:+ start:33 stop:197 length:165 start_codon:yes stop_codon:yes gene_type:complete